jgi:hypothetical protein
VASAKKLSFCWRRRAKAAGSCFSRQAASIISSSASGGQEEVISSGRFTGSLVADAASLGWRFDENRPLASREAWFDRADPGVMGETPEGRRAMQIAVEDEAHFIDFANSAIWLAKERVVIDRR